MTEVVFDDIELFLTGYIRERLTDVALLEKYPYMDGFEVDNREPPVAAANFPAKLIVVRDDGTTSVTLTTGTTAIGVSVLMGNVEDLVNSGQAARVIHAIVRGCARVESGNPVAAVTESTGPYAIVEAEPRARWYSTHELVTVGQAL